MTTVTTAEAQAAILARFARLTGESVPLAEAVGRVLGEGIAAPAPVPPFTNSAMDGYAVRAADTMGATTAAPVRLAVTGTIIAGSGVTLVEVGRAVRIMTGAPLPDGADAVIPVEATNGGTDIVALASPVAPGANVRRAGSDLPAGAVALIAGTRVTPGAVAVLASLGVARVPVVRRPRVAVLSTGNELVPPGVAPGPGQIADANGPLLAALVAQWGGEPVPLGIAPDDPAAVRRILAEAAGVDFVVTSGGASVGLFDVMRPLLADEGAAVFTRVRMRPGQPCAFGAIDGVPLLALPGNPGAAFVTFHVLARPALARMLGLSPELPPLVPARTRSDIGGRGDRDTYLRARLFATAQGWEVDTALPQGAGHLPALAAADALVLLPTSVARYAAGDAVGALLLHIP